MLPLAALALWLTARWLWPVRPAGRPALTTATVFAALFASGLAMQLQFGARLQSDGFYYFAYLRSLAFDRDVNFMNDYRLIGLGDKPHLFEPTVTGHAHSAWTIGPAIVWAPFYGAGHLSARSLHARGRAVEVDGASYPYRQAICIAGPCTRCSASGWRSAPRSISSRHPSPSPQRPSPSAARSCCGTRWPNRR